MVKIAVDAMGGDYAPQEIVKGAIQAVTEQGLELALVGPEEPIKREIRKYDTSALSIYVMNTNEVIEEGESPVSALHLKPDASIFAATRMVKDGRADAVVSMGYTGAVMVAAIEILGKLEGIKRPSAGTILCGFAPNTLVFDLGPNADCKPRDLLSFAVMGSVVAQKMFHIDNPTVALLSNGAEERKGNLLVKKAYSLFKESHLNFIGNVEGNNIPQGKANVIICDGFIGNILLKFCEGLGEAVVERLSTAWDKKIPEEQVETMVNDLFTLTHAAEEGGPIYGVNGVVVIGHGRSKAPQVANAIRVAKQAVESNLVEELRSELGKLTKGEIG